VPVGGVCKAWVYGVEGFMDEAAEVLTEQSVKEGLGHVVVIIMYWFMYSFSVL